MEAREVKLLDFLKGPKQFVIPIYQRTYSWTHKQCNQLWNDIIKAGKDDNTSGHFLGSVVYIGKGLYQVATASSLLVIDGQQRMTTFSLILISLLKEMGEDGSITDQSGNKISKRKLKNYFLINNDEDDEQRYKILLTKSDKETLKCLIDDVEITDNPSMRVLDNLQFFQNKIKELKGDLDILYKGISKLMIVSIVLDRDHDNPQLIFESLNSTGLELAQADLIRNYILMRLKPKQQEEIYNKYWYPMERNFGTANYSERFDQFMRDYLTVKLNRIPNIRDVYNEFKTYALEFGLDKIEELVEDIYRYSKYFVNMVLQKEPKKDLNKIFLDINTLKVDVAFPFLLEVYNDYEKELLNIEEFKEILRGVESYVFRRQICGIPTNSMNKTFATLQKEIVKDRYLESFKAAILLKKTYRRFPTDEEFTEQFILKDIYSSRNRNYLLEKLENYKRKEQVDVDEYTIEHIMPQNKDLCNEWRVDLGDNWQEVHEKYLHTIGNLTLTGYNSELSDKPFREKRDMKGGFKDSPIRLNEGLASEEKWNEDKIVARAKSLAQKSITIWKPLDLDPDTLDKYKKEEKSDQNEYSIEDHPHLNGNMLDLYNAFKERVLDLGPEVTETFLKLYVAFKAKTNFVDIVPQKSRLRLSLNLKFEEINDPKSLCKDVTNLGRWGNGDVEAGLKSFDQLDDIMELVKQAYFKQKE